MAGKRRTPASRASGPAHSHDHAVPHSHAGSAGHGVHTSHPEIIKRLKRADGHLQKIIAMIEEGRGCLDVAQQMHAVTKALESAKRAFVQDHIDGCLEQVTSADAATAGNALQEFKDITKYL